jgi:hypothetical protein
MHLYFKIIKIHQFLKENDIHAAPKNPINKDCKIIRETLQNSNLIFTKEQIKYLTQRKPTPPQLNARIKIQKQDIPIKPVINNINAPTYKLAKKLNNILKQQLQLENQYVTQNSEKLAYNITTIESNEYLRMATFDIKDLYVNILIEETLKITEQQLLKNNDKHKTQQLITMLHTILKQNYFE